MKKPTAHSPQPTAHGPQISQIDYLDEAEPAGLKPGHSSNFPQLRNCEDAQLRED
jgi:hypothetical protein